MTTLGYIFFLVKFFGGLILLFALGYLIGHLIKIDDFYK